MTTSAAEVPHGLHLGSALKLELIKAGNGNRKLTDVEGYAPSEICELYQLQRDEVDKDLKLKLLHLAAWTGDVSTIEHLKCIRETKFNEKTEGDFTPLHLAASRGHSEALQILLEYSDVNAESSEGFTALHLAAHGGHYECVRALLRKCSTEAHVNARDKVTGRTALHWAVFHTSSIKVFDELLEFPQVNVCSKDRAGLTPLHFATMNVIETELGDDKKYTFLEAIRNPSVLDETSEEWIQEISQDETKRLQLEEIHRSEVLDTDVEQTMQVILEGVPTQMVKKLLERDPNQVNDKVGDVRRFLSMPTVKAVGSRPWQKLSGITTVHPKRNLEEFMSGYTALHFAARQNNAELVTHLLTFPRIRVNGRDMIHGMTPLHCSLLTGSMKACARLMSFEGVDVNAQLVQGGQGEHQVWLPKGFRPRNVEVGVSSDELRKFRSLETPLHIGIRFCPPGEFLQMMTKVCSHPKFNPAICNREGVLPLQLAWRRSHFLAPDNRWTSWRSYFSHFRWPSERRKTAFKELQCALDIFEGHPGNASVMNNISDHQKRYQNIVSTAFVSATVFASLSLRGGTQAFPAVSASSGSSQPSPVVDVITFFWYTNTIAFFSAFLSLISCLGSFLSSAAQRQDHRLGDLDVLFLRELRPIISFLLVSFISGLTAYAAAVSIHDFMEDGGLYVLIGFILIGIYSLLLIGYGSGFALPRKGRSFDAMFSSGVFVTCVALLVEAVRRIIKVK